MPYVLQLVRLLELRRRRRRRRQHELHKQRPVGRQEAGDGRLQVHSRRQHHVVLRQHPAIPRDAAGAGAAVGSGSTARHDGRLLCRAGRRAGGGGGPRGLQLGDMHRGLAAADVEAVRRALSHCEPDAEAGGEVELGEVEPRPCRWRRSER